MGVQPVSEMTLLRPEAAKKKGWSLREESKVSRGWQRWVGRRRAWRPHSRTRHDWRWRPNGSGRFADSDILCLSSGWHYQFLMIAAGMLAELHI